VQVRRLLRLSVLLLIRCCSGLGAQCLPKTRARAEGDPASQVDGGGLGNLGGRVGAPAAGQQHHPRFRATFEYVPEAARSGESAQLGHLSAAVLKTGSGGKGRRVKKCRHPGRLAALPSGRLPPGCPVVVERGDDDRDDQPGQVVIHRVLDARVAAAQQGPFHCADSAGRDVGGSHRERVMRFNLPARRYLPIRKLSQRRVPLEVMLTPSKGRVLRRCVRFSYCYDACPLVSVHGPRMTRPDSAVRSRSYWNKTAAFMSDRRRTGGEGPPSGQPGTDGPAGSADSNGTSGKHQPRPVSQGCVACRPATPGLPPTAGVASRNVMGNRAVVDRGVDWVPGNFQHGRCGLCDRGWRQCSSRACRTGTYLW